MNFCKKENKWNESGFRPPYRLNWARRTSWGWWDDWDDTVLQTQDSKFEPWRSAAEHATSRSRRLPTILTFTHGWGRNIFCFSETAETGNRTPNSGVKGSGANHYLTTTLGSPPLCKKEVLTRLCCKLATRWLCSLLRGQFWSLDGTSWLVIPNIFANTLHTHWQNWYDPRSPRTHTLFKLSFISYLNIL